jgi:ketosteroid isomerase-like protein
MRRIWESGASDPADLVRYLDPEFEVHDFDVPDAGVYRGPDGWLEWIANWSAAWEDFGVETQDVVSAGSGRVIVTTRIWARGRSGITLERHDGYLWTLRDGKAVRLEYYATLGEALEAAGVDGG